MKPKYYQILLLILSFALQSNFANAGKVIPLMDGETFALGNGDVVACIQQPAQSPAPPKIALYRCTILAFIGSYKNLCGIGSTKENAYERAKEDCAIEYSRQKRISHGQAYVMCGSWSRSCQEVSPDMAYCR